jgi:hypothetical protein
MFAFQPLGTVLAFLGQKRRKRSMSSSENFAELSLAHLIVSSLKLAQSFFQAVAMHA